MPPNFLGFNPNSRAICTCACESRYFLRASIQICSLSGAFFFFFAMLSLISGVDQCADKQSLFCKRSLPLPRQLADARPLISFDARLQRMARADAQVGQ